MIHAVYVSVCLIQSLVPLWGWKLYKSRSCLLTISINLDFPADSHRSNAKCDAPNQHTLNSAIKLVAGSWGCVAFAVDEWTHSLSFCELWIFFMIFPTQRQQLRGVKHRSLWIKSIPTRGGSFDSILKPVITFTELDNQDKHFPLSTRALSPNLHPVKNRGAVKLTHTKDISLCVCVYPVCVRERFILT